MVDSSKTISAPIRLDLIPGFSLQVSLNPRLNIGWRNTLAVGVLAMLFPPYALLFFTDPNLQSIFTSVSMCVYSAIVTGIWGWAAYRTRRVQPRLYHTWLMWTLAFLSVCISNVQWMFAELASELPPDPSTGSFFALLMFPLAWWGITSIPNAKLTPFQFARQLSDSSTVMLGTALIFWSSWIAPLIRDQPSDWGVLLVTILYPACDLALIVVLISIFFKTRLEQPREPLSLLACASIAIVSADIWFWTLASTSNDQYGYYVHIVWLIGYVFAALAGVAQVIVVSRDSSADVQKNRSSRFVNGVRIGLPPIVLMLAFILMIAAHDSNRSDFEFMVAGVAAMFALVSVRQLLTLFENVRLARALRTELSERRRANETLEQHVAERTNELVLLNEQLLQNEHKLRFDAFHDKLTGLPNRDLFSNYLQHALQLARSYPTYKFSILFLDFDGFKVINDSLGHWLGDEFLVALARRLETCVGEGDMVARLGGDEFVLLLANVIDIHAAQIIAEHIQQEVRKPFDINGQRLFTSASIGVVMNDSANPSAEDMLRDADIAMYRAKELGKARYVIFDTSMRANAIARLSLETELHEALLHKQLHLNYQPIWDLTMQRLVGFEALARWHHPIRGVISPREFIPIAEETGLIVPLGEWVLEEACKQMKIWQVEYPQAPRLTISVNISTYQFRQVNLASLIERILDEIDFPASSLKLELTESSFMEDVDTAFDAFNRLRSLGVQLQLDDFGTGYSSLSYLHRLPINTLKIDQSFINRINSDNHNVEIVRAIASLAHNLQMNVIAEGVETQEQLTHVRTLGCEQVQGYLISKPLNGSDAQRFIQACSINSSKSSKSIKKLNVAPALSNNELVEFDQSVEFAR